MAFVPSKSPISNPCLIVPTALPTTEPMIFLFLGKGAGKGAGNNARTKIF